MKIIVGAAEFNNNLLKYARSVLIAEDCKVIVKHNNEEVFVLMKASSLKEDKMPEIKSVRSSDINLNELLESFAVRTAQAEKVKEELERLKNKSGPKTTEFWMSLILGGLAVAGISTGTVMNNPELMEVGKFVLSAVGLGYPVARGMAKSKS